MDTIKYLNNPDLKTIKENYKGNTLINGRFVNGNTYEKAPLFDVLKWKLSKNPQAKEKKIDTFRLKVSDIKESVIQDDYIIWLGHSSFLIKVKGITLLTDPCLYDIPTAKRQVRLPINPDSIQNVNYLLVSHDHRDHFQKKSVKKIVKNNPNIEILLPLKGNRLLNTKGLKSIKSQEAGWYQEYDMPKNIRIIFLPAKHWGRRGLNDFNKVLWGSFIIISEDYKIFFAGDSAYDENLYKEINHLFGKINVCIMPIGAYAPAFLMSDSHMLPEEAFRAFNEMQGSIFIPMHYGTYDLSDEPLGEPLERITETFNLSNNIQKLTTLDVGEIYRLK